MHDPPVYGCCPTYRCSCERHVFWLSDYGQELLQVATVTWPWGIHCNDCSGWVLLPTHPNAVHHLRPKGRG